MELELISFMAKFKQLLPKDDFNSKLEKNVHPPDWVNPTPAKKYNMVVIGGGTAGLVCAAGAAGLGAKVALIERELLGGDCLNVGCVPSKGIISSARIANFLRIAEDFGIKASKDFSVDFGKVMERMRALRAKISPNDSAKRFSELGVDIFFGKGNFIDSNTIEVEGKKLNFKKAVIATGARASAPPIPGLENIDFLTNESIFSLIDLPKRLGIIGAGAIGCEMAQTFSRLGSEVFLYEAMHGVLPIEDNQASQIVENSLVKDGVKLRCCGKNLNIEKVAEGIKLKVNSHKNDYDNVVDKLLVAVGRAPNIEGLNLEKVGVDFDKFGIKVNDKLQTTNPNIFAVGDICSKYKFTHSADFQARIVIQNALFMGRSKASKLVIPWCTYTSPELAHVGLTSKELDSKKDEIDTYTLELSEVDRAILEGDNEGFVRIHCKKGSDKILAATIVAKNSGDMISEITLAMTNGLGLKKIASTIHPYPTQAEAIRKIGDIYNRKRLTPIIKKIFNKWLSWQRK